jgi:hypothetical protein
MTSLAQTIDEAMLRLGPAVQDGLREIAAELYGLNLDVEDRLAALATALAACALIHHRRHKAVYLAAVRTWSLEISVGLAPPPLRLSRIAGEGPVDEGAEILIAGLDGLLDGLAQRTVNLQDRLVMELALFARLLGQHDANAVHLTLAAVSEALGDEDYRPGQSVHVPLDQMAMPLTRDACLATVAPRGVA